MKKLFFTVLATCLLTPAFGANIAVIDSGLDYRHDGLDGHIWKNAAELEDGRDNDGNGYQDDIYGWNFSGPDNKVIDYRYLGTFSPDVNRYFEIQGRMLLGTATETEIAWLRERQSNQEFIAQLQKFGNFVHGTHVAGIAVANSASQAMGVKIIPTEVIPTMNALKSSTKSVQNDELRIAIVKHALLALANQQMLLLEEVAIYVHQRGSDVANGSFGTGAAQAKMIGGALLKLALGRDATEAELNDVAKHFLTALIEGGQRMVRRAPNTLFVFAAGNDGSNNDVMPTSPANVRADNVITVAATYDNQFLARFSNYGATMVDVAAPGMLINSTIPGDGYMEVSGTSQAAPFVANIAARVKEMNPALTPADIKRIILGTVDMKAFLAGKVLSGGLVNGNRAVMAGQLSRTLAMPEAMTRARAQVRDVESTRTIIHPSKKVEAMPLLPQFRL